MLRDRARAWLTDARLQASPLVGVLRRRPHRGVPSARPVPFDVIQCSWPQPVREWGGRWASAPDWDAPPMPLQPQPRWQPLHDELCWTIDWGELFGGEMRGFHVVFQLRVTASGTLVFWADDGCVIRRNGQIVHCDRGAHMPARSSIEVRVGDRLEVAQWQATGAWLWGAWLAASAHALTPEPVDLLAPYLLYFSLTWDTQIVGSG